MLQPRFWASCPRACARAGVPGPFQLGGEAQHAHRWSYSPTPSVTRGRKLLRWSWTSSSCRHQGRSIRWQCTEGPVQRGLLWGGRGGERGDS